MATASQDVYAQAPLATEQREIRILSLAPGIGDSVLRGDLIVESLNYDDPHYTALSYTWSGPVSQCSIVIGGVPLHITENLELALRRIRGLNRPKNMWVDAICINQNDSEEKSVQVLLMGDIYANAARTVVWLGEQSADSDMAMDFIHSLRQRGPYQLDIYSDVDSSDEGNGDEEDSDGDECDKDSGDTDSDDNGSNKDDGRADDSDKDDSDKDDSDKDDSDKDDVDEDDVDEDDVDEDDGDWDSSDGSSSDEDKSDDENTHAEDTRKGISDADQIVLQAVTDLMQRQWWTRIWVVQEALKSRRVTVVCGAKEVDIAYFAQLVKPLLPVEQLFLDVLLKHNYKKPRLPSEQPFVEILSDWYLRKIQTETGGFSLMDLTLLTHRFQASVQKDKIYALLGLATPDARSWIVPDYSDAMTYRTILVRLTAYFLQFSSRPLRFASHCRATNGPSWVSDWTAIDSRIIKLIDREDADFEEAFEHHSLSKRSARSLERLPYPDHTTAKYNPRFDPPVQNLTKHQMPAILLVHGILVDRVRAVFQIPCVTRNGSETDMSFLKAKIREWETRMIEYLEMYQSEIGIVQKKPQWLKGATSKHKRKKALRRRDIKASLIEYLGRRESTGSDLEPGMPREDFDPLNFHGQIRYLHECMDARHEVTDNLRDYEAWIQQPQQNNCGSCKDHPHEHPDSHASCPTCKKLRRANKLGEKIIELNAGRTMFLTDDGHHYVVTFAVITGDIICRLWHSFYYLILRPTGDEHWTLVGHVQPDCVLLEEANKVDGSYARAKTEIFRVI